MNQEKFRKWMKVEKSDGTIRTYIARCMRAESVLGVDLDSEYKRDCGKTIICKLEYTRDDERNNVFPTNDFHFNDNTNIYMGIHSIRASVKKYFDFLSDKNDTDKE